MPSQHHRPFSLRFSRQLFAPTQLVTWHHFLLITIAFTSIHGHNGCYFWRMFFLFASAWSAVFSYCSAEINYSWPDSKSCTALWWRTNAYPKPSTDPRQLIFSTIDVNDVPVPVWRGAKRIVIIVTKSHIGVYDRFYEEGNLSISFFLLPFASIMAWRGVAIYLVSFEVWLVDFCFRRWG